MAGLFDVVCLFTHVNILFILLDRSEILLGLNNLAEEGENQEVPSQ